MYFDLKVQCFFTAIFASRNVWFQCLHGEQTRAAYLDLKILDIVKRVLSMVVDGEKT